MTRKNKTKGKKAKNGDGKRCAAPQPPQPPPPPPVTISRQPNDFLGFMEVTELLHAERHYNEQKRTGYVPPDSRVPLPQMPECAKLDAERRAEMGLDMEKMTYPVPTKSVPYEEYVRYRDRIQQLGVKSDVELVSIIEWDLQWIDAAAKYINELEESIYTHFPVADNDMIALDSLRRNRDVYMELRKRNQLEEDLMRTMRYMRNYLDKVAVEESLEEPYRESVDKYLETHPAEAKWMTGYSRGLYFSDYTRLVPVIFSSPAVYYESELVAKYGSEIDKNLLIEADMIRYERDEHLVQLSICRRWICARMIASRPKYLTGAMDKYLTSEPNALKALRLKLAYELISKNGAVPQPTDLSEQLRACVLNTFQMETGVDYMTIYPSDDDTPEEAEKKKEIRETLTQKYDSEMMAKALDSMLHIKDDFMKTDE